MSGKLACTLAALALGLPCGALAQVRTASSYEGLRYELVDRDPDDGITPWATLELVEVEGRAVVFDSKGTTQGECSITSMGSCSAVTADGAGSAWFDGVRSGSQAWWSQEATGGVHVTSRAVFNYSFSPNTEFALFLDTSVEQVPAGAADPLGAPDAGGGLFFFISSDEGWFRSYEQYTPGARTEQILLPSWDEPVRGQFRAYSDIVARHTVPPVPESSTWAMLSAGLLLAAARGWRERRPLSRTC